MMQFRRSIAYRISRSFLALQVAGIVLFGLSSCALYRNSLRNDKVQTLKQRSDRIVALLLGPDQKESAQLDRRFADLSGISGEYPYIQVRALNGRLLYPSRPRVKDDLSWVAVSATSPNLRSVSQGGHEYLVYSRREKLDGQTVEVLVGGSMAESELRVRTFALDIALSGTVLIALSIGTTMLVSRRCLGPISELTRAAQHFGAARLSERLPVPNTGDELQRLAESWNELLSRLEAAIDELRCFTADASHELRSPIALIRIDAEYLLRHGYLPEEARRCLNQIVGECKDATDLLTNMLVLARADAGMSFQLRECVNLTQLLQDAGQKMTGLTNLRGQTLSLELPDTDISLNSANETELRQAIGAILDNASKYTHEGGSIRLICETKERKTMIRVIDNGKGIGALELPRVFDRFYRIPCANPADHIPGTGLGLAIARQIVLNHGGEITIVSELGRGTDVRLLFS